MMDAFAEMAIDRDAQGKLCDSAARNVIRAFVEEVGRRVAVTARSGGELDGLHFAAMVNLQDELLGETPEDGA